MSLSRPNAIIILDGERLTSAQAGLVSLRIDLGFNTHDKIQMSFWPDSKLAKATIGNDLAIELSTVVESDSLLSSVSDLFANDNDKAVWTGTVDEVQSSADLLSISGLAKSAQLSRMRMSATWADQSIANIIKDMAGELEAEVEADLTLANYSIDNSRSVWSYLYDLAQITGAELSSAGSGGLRFLLAAKNAGTVSLRYGADIIQWQLATKQTNSITSAAEHGSASSAGNDKWHWIAHDPVGAGADSTVLPAAFASKDAANLFTEAAKAKQERSAIKGQVWLGGRADLRPGSLIELSDLPQGDSPTLRVKAVSHQMDGENGFITALAVEGYSESSSFSL